MLRTRKKAMWQEGRVVVGEVGDVARYPPDHVGSPSEMGCYHNILKTPPPQFFLLL